MISAFDSACIEIKGSNIRNSHIYLRPAAHMIPDDAIGGSNKRAAAARALTVEFDPGRVVETDVAGDKMILRNRSGTRDFFERAEARPGDHVRIERLSDYRFRISLEGGLGGR